MGAPGPLDIVHPCHPVTTPLIRDFLLGRTQQVVLEGKKSYTSNVTSGVPQGTVLGPLLFLVFITGMPNTVSSNIRLFADDALLYPTIHTDEDALALQTDLDNLQTWERKWQMSFNPDKCEVLKDHKQTEEHQSQLFHPWHHSPDC